MDFENNDVASTYVMALLPVSEELGIRVVDGNSGETLPMNTLKTFEMKADSALSLLPANPDSDATYTLSFSDEILYSSDNKKIEVNQERLTKDTTYAVVVTLTEKKGDVVKSSSIIVTVLPKEDSGKDPGKEPDDDPDDDPEVKPKKPYCIEQSGAVSSVINKIVEEGTCDYITYDSASGEYISNGDVDVASKSSEGGLVFDKGLTVNGNLLVAEGAKITVNSGASIKVNGTLTITGAAVNRGKISAETLSIKGGEIELASDAYIEAEEINKVETAAITYADYAAKISSGIRTKSDLTSEGITGIAAYSLKDKNGYLYYGPSEDGKSFIYEKLLSFAKANDEAMEVKVNPALTSENILFRGMTYGRDLAEYVVVLDGMKFSWTNKPGIENAENTILVADENTSDNVISQYNKFFTTNGNETVLYGAGFDKKFGKVFLSQSDNGISDILKIDLSAENVFINFAKKESGSYIKINESLELSADGKVFNIDLADNALEVTDNNSLSLNNVNLKGTGNSSTKDMIHLPGTAQLNLSNNTVIECDSTETGASVFSGDSSSENGVVNFKDLSDNRIIVNASDKNIPLVKGDSMKELSEKQEDGAGRFINSLMDFGETYNGVTFNNNKKSVAGLKDYLGYIISETDGKYRVSYSENVKPKAKISTSASINITEVITASDAYLEEKSNTLVSDLVIAEGEVYVSDAVTLQGYIFVKAGATLQIKSDACLNMRVADSGYEGGIVIETGGSLVVEGEAKADGVISEGILKIYNTGKLEVESFSLGAGADTSINGVLKADEIKSKDSASYKPVIKCCVKELGGDINAFSIITKNNQLNDAVKFIQPAGESAFSSEILKGSFGTTSEDEINIDNFSFLAGGYYYYGVVYNNASNYLYFITPNMLRDAGDNAITLNTSLVGTVNDDFTYTANENRVLYFLGEQKDSALPWTLDLCDKSFSTLATNKVIPIYNDNVVLRYKDESIRNWVYMMKKTANMWLQVYPCVLEESSGVKYSNPFGGDFYINVGPKIESTLNYAISMKDETTKYIKVLNHESVYIDSESEIDLSDVPLVVEGSATKTTTLYINTNIKGKGNSDIGCLIELSRYANLNICDNCQINVEQKNIKTVIDNSYNTTSIKNNIEFGNNSLISASQGLCFIGKNVNDSYIEELSVGMDVFYLYKYDTTNADKNINVSEMTNLGYSIKPDTCDVVIEFTRDDDGICKVQRTS